MAKLKPDKLTKVRGFENSMCLRLSVLHSVRMTKRDTYREREREAMCLYFIQPCDMGLKALTRVHNVLRM
jgi:hypothetical protein